METPYLELRKTDDDLLELYKNGLSTDRVFNFAGEKIIDLSDEFFDLAVSGMPIEEEITIFPRFNGKEGWISWIDAVRDEKYITMDLFCDWSKKEKDESYVLNAKILTAKIMEQAWNHGFITEHLDKESSNTGFRKRFNSLGTLRDKIKTMMDILDDFKAKAENEMLESISKGEMFIKLADVDKMNPSKSIWLPG